MQNLTTLANAKGWVGVTSTTDDALLTRLIASCSRFILAYLNRPTLAQTAYSDVYDGVGLVRQTLRQWPVLSVSSVTIGSQSISASSNGSAGYTLTPWDGQLPGRPQAVNLTGYSFCRDYSNVIITYAAGYVIQNEAQTVTNSQVTALAPLGMWSVDQGVSYANGTPLVPVASNPSFGQYSVENGVYTFNVGDAAASVLLSYSFVPFDIEQACIEMVAERYSYKGRIGQVSKTLGGQETMAFSLKDIPDFVRLLLQPYKRVVLV